MMKDQDIKYGFFLDENWIYGHGIKKKIELLRARTNMGLL